MKENGSFSEIKQKKRVESFVYRDICERAVREITRSYENISFADMKHNERTAKSDSKKVSKAAERKLRKMSKLAAEFSVAILH